MNRFCIYILVPLLFVLPNVLMANDSVSRTQEKTIINDHAEAAMLLGKHLFGNLKISTFNSYPDGGLAQFGEVNITNDNGIYRFEASLEAYHTPYRPVDPRERKGGYNNIDGIITEIHSEYFLFKGYIESGLVERKPDEETILEWMSEGETREEAERYRYNSTISNPIDPNHLSVCIYPKDITYKFSRENIPEHLDKAVYWRTVPKIPEYCDRKNVDFIDVFIEKVAP